MRLPKQYNPQETEKKLQKFWEKNKIYKFNPKSKKIFSIDTPPPTVSGNMHLGHAFSYSQMDFIARYKRMNNFSLFYPFGTDDNGLATERLIEKEKNVKASKMNRQEFINLCLKTLIPIRQKYIQDFKAIGLSCDYSIFYSTIDAHCRKLSQKSFIELYNLGREYRKEAPVIWCPECQTAIAQVELEDKEFTSYFNDLIFKVDGKDLIISTTRPELLPACIAIFAHPSDNRYKNLIGKTATVPLFDFSVPILEDDKVDMEKGTGIVMCCSFGDQTDAEWYKSHKLPLKIAITKDGKMTKIAGKYEGLTIKEARKKIIEDLKTNNLLVNQKQISHTVNVHERCGTEIEILETKQWFIRYLDLKEQFLKNGKQLNWYPEHMYNRLENWIKGLQWDWCISRQRFFGIPFPVWYCEKCNQEILADIKQLPVDPLISPPPIRKCPKCGSNKFIPEKDVLDTWATSSLTPQLAIQLFPKNLEKRLFPMSLRPSAHDIISFWQFNTMVKSQLHYKKNPWKDVMISGWILDPHGKKMAKSRGNIVEPQDMIQKYCADALRFLAASSKLGEDLPFQEKELVSGKKTVIKLWNAFNFSQQHLKTYKPKKVKLNSFDLWLLSKLNNLVKNSIESFENYEYSKVKSETENFFWHTFCDNYLEIIKKRLYEPKNTQEKSSAQFTLYFSLLTILKLFAPIMPFITEEIYQAYFKKYEKTKSIHLSQFPKYNTKLTNLKIEKEGDEFIDIISKVRQFKTTNHKPLKEEIILTLPFKYKNSSFLSDLKSVTSAKEINFDKELNITF